MLMSDKLHRDLSTGKGISQSTFNSPGRHLLKSNLLQFCAQSSYHEDGLGKPPNLLGRRDDLKAKPPLYIFTRLDSTEPQVFHHYREDILKE